MSDCYARLCFGRLCFGLDTLKAHSRPMRFPLKVGNHFRDVCLENLNPVLCLIGEAA